MNDDSYFYVYLNDKPTSEASGEYSTDEYYSKAFSWIETHYLNKKLQDKPFFIYLALQDTHGSFAESIIADYETEYQACCDENYSESFLNWKNCKDVRGTKFGTFLDTFKHNEMLSNNNVCENTLIMLKSDHGGSLDEASSNYTLRGGKNTFHEGEQKGTVLDGVIEGGDDEIDYQIKVIIIGDSCDDADISTVNITANVNKVLDILKRCY